MADHAKTRETGPDFLGPGGSCGARKALGAQSAFPQLEPQNHVPGDGRHRPYEQDRLEVSAVTLPLCSLIGQAKSESKGSSSPAASVRASSSSTHSNTYREGMKSALESQDFSDCERNSLSHLRPSHPTVPPPSCPDERTKRPLLAGRCESSSEEPVYRLHSSVCPSLEAAPRGTQAREAPCVCSDTEPLLLQGFPWPRSHTR